MKKPGTISSSPLTIFELIKRISLYKQRTAFDFRGKRITYCQLLDDLTALSYLFLPTKLKKGSRVVLLMPNGYEFILAFLALTALGIVVVPLDPNIRDEFTQIAKDSRPSAVLLLSSYSQRFKDWFGELKSACDVIEIDLMLQKKKVHQVFRFEDLLQVWKKRKIKKDDIGCVLYTSGMTGTQKGAVLTQNGLMKSISVLKDNINIKRDDRFLGLVPLFHGYGLTFNFLLPIWIGAQTCFFESFHLKKILKHALTYQPSIIVGNPSIYRLLLKIPEITKKYLSEVKFCLTGGSPLSGVEALHFTKTYNIPFYNCYGSTETGTISLKSIKENSTDLNSVGKPLTSVKVKIVDDDNAKTQKGDIGEIAVHNPWMMKEYLNKKTDTQRVLRGKWYYTGDLGKKDAGGNLILYGRKTDMIKTKGFKVFPREIEDVILQYPKINDAAVFGIKSEMKGEEIYATVELKDGEVCTKQEILAFCRKKLLDYKIPRKVFFFTSFPKLSNGKINRTALKNEVITNIEENVIPKKLELYN